MKKILTSVMACACLVGFSACDSFLDEAPKSQLTTNSYYMSEAHAQQNVNYLYRTGVPSLLGATGAYAGSMQQCSGFAGQDTTVDSSWVVDGSYLRMNMIQLGYTFDSKVIEPLGLSALRLYASANNLFLICSDDFTGFDPESTSQSDKFGQNMTFFSYPRARTFTFGVNVTF